MAFLVTRVSSRFNMIGRETKATITYSWRIPGRGGSRLCSRSCRRDRGLGRRLRLSSSAALARQGDVVGVHVESEVLQRVRIANRQRGVANGQLEALGVSVGVVLGDAFTDARDVQQAVDQVGAEVEVQLAGHDLVPVAT